MWVDQIAGVVTGLNRIATTIRGAERLPEAAALLVGLPRFDRSALAEAGFEPDVGLVAWQSGGDVWCATRLRHDRAVEHVAEGLRKRGHAVTPLTPPPTAGQWWQVGVRSAPDRRQAEMRLLDGVLLLRWRLGESIGDVAPPTVADFTAYDTADRLPVEALKAARGQIHARLQSLATLGFQKAARHAVGPAVMLFGRLIDGLQRAEIDVDVGAEAQAVAVRLRSAPDATKAAADYHQNFLPEGTPRLDLGGLLPDEVALLLRARLNPALLAMIPAVLLSRLLPSSSLAYVHPTLAALDAHTLLIEQLDGQVAVGLLGVDDEASADPRVWMERGLRRTVGGFVAASLRSDQAAIALLERSRKVLSEAGVALSNRELAGHAGFTVNVGHAPWSLLRKGRGVIWVSGKGEIERFERVARGRFPNLATAAASELERQVASGGDQWLGGLVTTGRIARSMRRRGVPAHFVRMVAGVGSLATTLRLRADGVDFDVALRPRQTARKVP